MSAVSCMSPQEIILSTKFIEETQPITCRNCCTPSRTFYKAAFTYSYKMLSFGVSVTSHQNSQRVTLQQTESHTGEKRWGAKVPFVVLLEAQLWCGSLLPTMAMTSAFAPPFNLVTAAPGTGTGKSLSVVVPVCCPVVGKWMTHINPGAGERVRGESSSSLELHSFLVSRTAP